MTDRLDADSEGKHKPTGTFLSEIIKKGRISLEEPPICTIFARQNVKNASKYVIF